LHETLYSSPYFKSTGHVGVQSKENGRIVVNKKVMKLCEAAVSRKRREFNVRSGTVTPSSKEKGEGVQTAKDRGGRILAHTQEGGFKGRKEGGRKVVGNKYSVITLCEKNEKISRGKWEMGQRFDKGPHFLLKKREGPMPELLVNKEL